MAAEFDAEQFERARREIHAMRERSRDYRAVWEEVLDWWAHQNRVHWGSRGARWGQPWKELSPNYLAWKRDQGYQGDILVRESDLLRSMADRPLRIERVTPLELTAGTDLRYARFHQTGTRFMPARPLVNAAAVRAEGVISDIAANWVTTGHARRS